MTAGLPNYQCQTYLEQASVWALLDDLFFGAERWLGRDASGKIRITEKARQYLPREPEESDGDYLNRLIASPFSDRFAQSIRKFVNLVLSNGIGFSEDMPPVIQEHLSGVVDNRGGTLRRFVQDVGLAIQRHGHTFVLVDCVPQAQPLTQADRAPRLVWSHYTAPDLIHWVTEVRNGVITPVQVTLVDRVTLPDGQFGEREQTFYRVLTPGRYDSWTVGKDKQGKEVAVYHPDRSGLMGWVLPNGQIEPFPFIPIACIYGGLREGFWRSRPPQKSLADLNLTHYRVYSDHLRKMHLCSVPVPEIRDSMRPEGEDLVIGAGSFVHIRDPQGSFNWKEPLATSLEQSRREVLDLEQAMDVLAAAYLINPSDRQAAKTTEAQVVELESSLQIFADELVEGFARVLEIHARCFKLSTGGRLLLSGDVLKNTGKDSQLLLAMATLPGSDLLDKRSFLEWMRDNDYHPGLDVDQVLKRIGEAVELVAVGKFIAAPAPDTPAPLPPIDPAIVIGAYVDLAKAGVIPVEKALQILNQFGVSSRPATAGGGSTWARQADGLTVPQLNGGGNKQT